MSQNIRKITFRYVRPAKIQISLRFCAVRSESSVGAFLIDKDANILHAYNEDSYQTARMRSDLSLRWAHLSDDTFSLWLKYGCFTLSTLGKIFSRRHMEIVFLFFPENRIWHFMQIVSLGDNLHEISNPGFWENKKIIINLSSAELAKRVVKVKMLFSEVIRRHEYGLDMQADKNSLRHEHFKFVQYCFVKQPFPHFIKYTIFNSFMPSVP